MRSAGRWLAAATVLLSLGCNPAPRIPPPPDTGPELEALQLQQQLMPPLRLAGSAESGWSLRERMAHHRVPGVAIAVVDDGELRFVKGWGVLAAGGDTPITADTRFQGSSIAKALTATLVLRLADQGVLGLDDPVAPWADGVATHGVTVRQLLAHTGGVGPAGFAGYQPAAPLPNLAQILTGTAPATSPAVHVAAAPGSTWSYSGGGFQVLQHVVETHTTQPFASLMAAEVLAPLGMAHSRFAPQPDEPAATAAGHDRRGEPLPGRWRLYPELAAAGLWTTADDLARWLIDIQKSHAGKPSRRLQRDSTRQLVSAQEPGGWGLGVVRGGAGQSAWFGHLGGNAGYPAAVLGFVSSGHGAVILTNGDGGFGLIRELVAALAELYAWPAFRPATLVAVDPPRAELERFVGRWDVASIDSPLIIALDDQAKLQASFLGRTSELHATSSYRLVDLHEGWSFEMQDEGDALTVHLWPGYQLDAKASV